MVRACVRVVHRLGERCVEVDVRMRIVLCTCALCGEKRGIATYMRAVKQQRHWGAVSIIIIIIASSRRQGGPPPKREAEMRAAG